MIEPNNQILYDFLSSKGTPDGWKDSHKLSNYEKGIKLSKFCGKIIDTTWLDAGCGTGDFSKFLQNYKIKDYFGIDIYEPNIWRAKTKYPGENFQLIDILNWKTSKKFDYVYASGSLSTRKSENNDENYIFLEKFVKKMWFLSKKGVYFNFLMHEKIDHRYIFLYSPDIVKKICIKIVADKNKIKTEIDEKRNESHYYLVKQKI